MSLDDEDDLLEHAKSGMTPGEDQRAAMRARLLSSVAAVGAAGAAGGAASTAAASAATGAGLGGAAKLLVLVAAVSAVGGLGYVASSTGGDSAPDPSSGRESGVSPSGVFPSGVSPSGVSPSGVSPSGVTANGITQGVDSEVPSPAPSAPVEVASQTVGPSHGAPGSARPGVLARERARGNPNPVAHGEDRDHRGAEPGPAPGAPTEPPAGSATGDVPPGHGAPDALAEEATLVRRARAALQRGDAAASLRILEMHASRYPDGFLAEERDVQRVRALCAQGDTAMATRLAARFARAHPGSMHAPAMRNPCGETP